MFFTVDSLLPRMVAISPLVLPWVSQSSVSATLGQAFAQRSKQHLSELVFGREVELHTHGLDHYSRVLATVSSLLS
jgi:hypothetical protein